MKRPCFLPSEDIGGNMILEKEDDEEYCCGGGGGGFAGANNKRRLGAEQVRALEQSFEVENRLEPERKARLARDLNLQPRQVAVWFQNRRARWKTKQLERDFSNLKSRYDALRLDLDSLRRENGSLAGELAALREKISGEVKRGEEKTAAAAVFGDGWCESDSSGVMNGDCSPTKQGEGILCRNNEGVEKEILKVEEEDWGEPSGASLFSDEHGSTLAWFSAELAGDNGCW